MPDLDALRDFALQRGHNLTHPLRHDHVVALANAWFPEIRFHEKEQFHPLDLSGLLGIPPEVFVSLPESAKEEFRVGVHTAALNNGQQIIEHFDPPFVHIDSGNARRVLGSSANVANAMADPALARDAIFTYGARLEAGREFFGASDTVSGATEPTPGSRGISLWWCAQSYACCSKPSSTSSSSTACRARSKRAANPSTPYGRALRWKSRCSSKIAVVVA
jgi:hypothetical protein